MKKRSVRTEESEGGYGESSGCALSAVYIESIEENSRIDHAFRVRQRRALAEKSSNPFKFDRYCYEFGTHRDEMKLFAAASILISFTKSKRFIERTEQRTLVNGPAQFKCDHVQCMCMCVQNLR